MTKRGRVHVEWLDTWSELDGGRIIRRGEMSRGGEAAMNGQASGERREEERHTGRCNVRAPERNRPNNVPARLDQ